MNLLAVIFSEPWHLWLGAVVLWLISIGTFVGLRKSSTSIRRLSPQSQCYFAFVFLAIFLLFGTYFFQTLSDIPAQHATKIIDALGNLLLVLAALFVSWISYGSLRRSGAVAKKQPDSRAMLSREDISTLGTDIVVHPIFLATTIMTIVLGLYGLLEWKFTKVVNDRVDRETASAIEAATNRLGARIESANTEMSRQITNLLQTERILAIVDRAVETNTGRIMTDRIQPALAGLSLSSSNQLRSLEEEIDYFRTVNLAQAFDYGAFQKLWKTGRETGRFQKMAAAQNEALLDSVQKRAEQDQRFSMESPGSNQFTGPFTSEEISIKLGTAHPRNREAAVQDLRRMGLTNLVSELIPRLNRESDLVVAYHISTALNSFTGFSIPLGSPAEWIVWFSTNKNERFLWPTNLLEDGIAGINARLNLVSKDPWADFSRATLALQFFSLDSQVPGGQMIADSKHPDNRWIKLARIRKDLADGKIAQATKDLAAWRAAYPAQKQIFLLEHRFWSGVDWSQITD